jgi:hypothetical protein
VVSGFPQRLVNGDEVEETPLHVAASELGRREDLIAHPGWKALASNR